MIWNAPSWSMASPEYTHGFPRKLVSQHHGGFLPGNITVTAKASNLTLRRLAVCDVACLVSRATTAGSGLNRARLLNLRYAAIRYQTGTFCPQYLASAMVEYGVNFATFEALSPDTLETLHSSLKRGWREGDESTLAVGSSTTTDEEDDADEPLLECPQSVMQEIGKSSNDGTAQRQSSRETDRLLCDLLARLSSQPGQQSDSSSDGDGSGAHTAAAAAAEATTSTGATAGLVRRKKRRTSSVGGARAKAIRTEERAPPEGGQSGNKAKKNKGQNKTLG